MLILISFCKLYHLHACVSRSHVCRFSWCVYYLLLIWCLLPHLIIRRLGTFMRGVSSKSAKWTRFLCRYHLNIRRKGIDRSHALEKMIFVSIHQTLVSFFSVNLQNTFIIHDKFLILYYFLIALSVFFLPAHHIIMKMSI